MDATIWRFFDQLNPIKVLCLSNGKFVKSQFAFARCDNLTTLLTNWTHFWKVDISGGGGVVNKSFIINLLQSILDYQMEKLAKS